ncbi:hypothetical protein PCANB_002124 [Pneumocystis canis]|nr:hypothetical protein PCK1_001865 [Pneumocystis canis]KAG5439549.1 hypothetical protein PCANB_002124 [Pneumocystis canis]
MNEYIKETKINKKIQNNSIKNSRNLNNSCTQISTDKPLSIMVQSQQYKLFQSSPENNQEIYHFNTLNKRETYQTSPLKTYSEFQQINSNLIIKPNSHFEKYLIKENLSSEFQIKSNHSLKDNFFYTNNFQSQENSSKIHHFTKDPKVLSPLFQQTDQLFENQSFQKNPHTNDNFILQDNHLSSQNTNSSLFLKYSSPTSKNNNNQSSIIFSENKTPLSSPYASPGKKLQIKNLTNLSNIPHINNMMSSNYILQKSPESSPCSQSSFQSSPRTSKMNLGPILTEISDNTKFARTNRKILDLEISNTSLLALNDTLEKQTRRQMSEIKELRKKLITEKIYITSSTSNSTKNSDESNSDSNLSQDSNSSINDHQKIINNSLFFEKSLKRALKLTKHLINQGHQALKNPKNIDTPIYLKVVDKNANS